MEALVSDNKGEHTLGGLFHIGDEEVHCLRPIPFHATHKEEDLQGWVDRNPHLLNNGQPMLSLGTEIKTQHDHYIDNLFLDGNGCLVVAELKRGKSPRDVTAQAVDYGAYASQLDWERVETLCLKRHGGTPLERAYRECLGHKLQKPPAPDHRLLILAETYDPSVEDAAAYLNNIGVDLTLLAFRYFELNGSKILDVRVVLGEIPEQRTTPSQPTTQAEASATDGYRNWLSRTIRDELPRHLKSQGYDVTLGRGERYLSFIPQPWPYPLGDCRFSIGINTRSIGIYFSYLTDRTPRELVSRMRELVDSPNNPYDLNRLTVAEQWTTLTHTVPKPILGDTGQVERVIDEVLQMVKLIQPLVQNAGESDE